MREKLTNEQLRAYSEWARQCDNAYSRVISKEPKYRRLCRYRSLALAKAARLEASGASPAVVRAILAKANRASRLKIAHERARLHEMGLLPFDG